MKFEVKVLSKIVLDPFVVVTMQPVTDGFVQGGKLVLDLAESQAADFIVGETYEFGLESDFLQEEASFEVRVELPDSEPPTAPEGPPPEPPAPTPPTGPVVEPPKEDADYEVADDPPAAEVHDQPPPDEKPPLVDPETGRADGEY